MKLRTLPVYSKLANDDEMPQKLAERLPTDWQLSQHQLETYYALTSGHYDVIFNTAMTGDGKSLAGQLPTLIDFSDNPLFAMYPTNELIRDQEKQLVQTSLKWGTELFASALDSATLDQLMDSDDFIQRGEALLSLINNRDVLLTNPDIFHYMMEHFYRRPKDAADKIIGPLVQKFRQFTFDEFHIFETPQVISVINAMLFIKEITGWYNPRFLFLSATPDKQMTTFLNRSGLRYCNINPAEAGWYAHTATAPEPTQWRQILRESDIHFAIGRVEEWIEAHLEDILLPFFRENKPRAKGAIIVNSIASAMRLTAKLQPRFAQHDLTVLPNTGLTSRTGRADSYEADLLIGTSTVDVGVDFDINFLLFESLNSGTFMQRLGRLGRHGGYIRNGQTHPFETFVAYALLPSWVAESLFQGRDGQPPALKTDEIITREQLTRAIETTYPPASSFDGYVQDWGKFQSMNVIASLKKSAPTRSQYNESGDRLGNCYQQTFDISLRQAFGQRKGLKAEGNEKLFDEALSFRGGSYFQCAILDDTEGGEPKLYDLFGLISNGILTAIDEATFNQALNHSELSPRRVDQANGPNSGPLGYFRLRGWREEREAYGLHLHQDLNDWGVDKFGQDLVVSGWQVDAAGMNPVNKRLRRRKLPATICLAFQHPLELKRRLYLPPLFPVFSFTSQDGVSGCVAFGREALLLHTKLKRRSLDCGGGAVIL